MKKTIGIMGNGPMDALPDLASYKREIDIWIGADRGALRLIEEGIGVTHAVGDFDSISPAEKEKLEQTIEGLDVHPIEKDETDIEIAIQKACDFNPESIYLFGVTGGRLDHALISIQLLYHIVTKQIRGKIIDKSNQLEMTMPGKHIVEKSSVHPYISFVPYTKYVRNLTLDGFYYPLADTDISWGSTRCISNELLAENGTFSYEEGTLLLIKSRDANTSFL